MKEEKDFEGVWRRLAVRYAVHYEWTLEESYQYLLVCAAKEFARAIFLGKRDHSNEALSVNSKERRAALP